MSGRLHRGVPAALRTTAVALAVCAPFGSGRAADTDIYGPTASGAVSPNVVFLLDNTSNWSANNQAWDKSSVDAKCNALTDAAQKTICLGYSTQVFSGATKLTQGQVQLRALKLVLNELVCSGTANALKVNVGLSLLASQSTLSNGHGIGVINYAVQPLTGTAATSSTCKTIIDQLDKIDSKIQDPDYKAPSSANYGAALYEIFKYFGGHSNPTLAGNVAPNGGSPTGATGYGPIRYSVSNVLDDVNAFTSGAKTTYKSPIDAANSCGGNYVVLVGNTYPNAEPNNGGPTIFSGINYTPPALSAVTSDTSRYADEWTYFLSNTDVSSEAGQQRVYTYTINTFNDKPDAGQGKLLKSMAAVGGVGAAGYLEIGGDLYKLVQGLRDILINIAAVYSVFTATTLPVLTTTQGTFLNQIFVGTFRPDANAAPRWVGNLKQYQFGLIGGTLDLVDKNGNSAVLAGAGFFAATAESFWSESSVFFSQLPSGTPATASDLPDGAIVEKGGAAQQLRKANLQGASTRNVKTLSAGSLVSFSTASGFSAAEVAWIRGENNQTTAAGDESFNGSYSNSGTTTLLGTTGARHSIHGDVLHSRPVALNYGSGDVVVYYGSNDGFFHAVDGNQTGGTAGQELWSFIAPEHYSLLTRLRNGTPTVHLPETNSSGGTIAAPTDSAIKGYGMDGPIGVYARYSSGGSAVFTAILYPTMRRGGSSVYAFNVTSKSAPTYLWHRDNSSSGYSKLAQTWSMPKPVVFSSATITAPILLMGGGYDPAEDTNSSGGIGNVVYVINGESGVPIAALDTDFSVPSDVTVVDVNGDGEPDRAYVADVRGNLYRIDFPTTGILLDPASWSAVRAVKIASLGGKVFFAPDVVATKNFVAVLVGTGDREKPLTNSKIFKSGPNPDRDKFVLVKDNVLLPRASALTIADLTKVATIDDVTMAPTSPDPTAKNDPDGCYLELASNGEKVVNAPFTIAGATYFGTNRPKPASATSCSADLGEAYAYKFPLFCGVPAKPNKIIGGGLPPSPVGGIVTLSVPSTLPGAQPGDVMDVKVPFVIGSGEGGSSFKPEEPKPPIPPIRTRQHWRIDNSNR